MCIEELFYWHYIKYTNLFILWYLIIIKIMLRKTGLHFLGIEKKEKPYTFSSPTELAASIVNFLAYLNLN